jgi:hypothetical protein
MLPAQALPFIPANFPFVPLFRILICFLFNMKYRGFWHA